MLSGYMGQWLGRICILLFVFSLAEAGVYKEAENINGGGLWGRDFKTKEQCAEWCESKPDCLATDYFKPRFECWWHTKATACGRSKPSGYGSAVVHYWTSKGDVVCGGGHAPQVPAKQETPAVCTIQGDPHYQTFDGQMIHFMGTCKYIVAKPLMASGSNKMFNIEAKTEALDKNPVSYLRYLDIDIGNTRIRLGQGKSIVIGTLTKEGNVFVMKDRQQYTAPVKNLPQLPGVEIQPTGLYIVVTTDFGLTIKYNGQWDASITLPASYKQAQMQGICGNFNGNAQDDLQTKERSMSPATAAGYQKIGESWQTFDEDDRQKCPYSPAQDLTCNNQEVRNLCNPLKDNNGVFKACVQAATTAGSLDILTTNYDSCVIDSCTVQQNRNKLVCDAFESTALVCSMKFGVYVDWQKSPPCTAEQPCGANMEFKPQMTGCPATCAEPNRPQNCRLPDAPGCQCRNGYLLRGAECIPQQSCGCFKDGITLKMGESKVAQDCSKTYSCVANGNMRVENLRPCHGSASCVTLTEESQPRCTCKEGFQGDGFSCSKLQLTESECLIQGDPHITTFDGQLIHYQGKCKYIAVTTQQFNIYVKTHNSYDNTPVSYTKFLDIDINNRRIRLGPGLAVQIGTSQSGNLVSPTTYTLPVNTQILQQFLPGGEIVMDNGFMHLKSSIGLRVKYNGQWNSQIFLAEKFRNSVRGLCGNFNGNREDDLNTKEGNSAVDRGEIDYAKLGDSWFVNDDTGDKGCARNAEIPRQTGTKCANEKQVDDACKILADERQFFGPCVKKAQNSGMSQRLEDFLTSCKYDLCLEPSKFQEMRCRTYSTFADFCSTNLKTPSEWIMPSSCIKNVAEQYQDGHRVLGGIAYSDTRGVGLLSTMTVEKCFEACQKLSECRAIDFYKPCGHCFLHKTNTYCGNVLPDQYNTHVKLYPC